MTAGLPDAALTDTLCCCRVGDCLWATGQADNPRWVAPLVLLGHQTRSREADKTLFGLLKEKFTVHEVSVWRAIVVWL